MRTLSYTRVDDEPFRHSDDVERMRLLLADNGYDADARDLRHFWEDHSERSCAGWLILPDDDELLDTLLSGMTEGDR